MTWVKKSREVIFFTEMRVRDVTGGEKTIEKREATPMVASPRGGYAGKNCMYGLSVGEAPACAPIKPAMGSGRCRCQCPQA